MKKCSYLFLLTLILTTTCLYAQHNVYLRQPNSIPLYAQQTNVWCGAGSAQMMLEGYPNGVNYTYQQRYIWNQIQNYKQEQGWYCDPAGLMRVLRALGGNRPWQTCYWRYQGSPLMHHIAKWMTNYRYPSAVLVYGHQHWVVIVGLSTNANPNQHNQVALTRIEIHDPWKARHVLMNGSTWYSRYWYKPGQNPNSVWNNCYVSVSETASRETEQDAPQENTKATAPAYQTKETTLSVSEVEKSLPQLLATLPELDQEPYSTLKQMAPLATMLVNQNQDAYYLIPLGDPNSQISYGALTLNAYDGSFSSIATFHTPMNYLTYENLKQQTGHLGEIRSAKLLFHPSNECRSPFDPVWQLQVKEREAPIYLTQQQEVFENFTPLRGGK